MKWYCQSDSQSHEIINTALHFRLNIVLEMEQQQNLTNLSYYLRILIF